MASKKLKVTVNLDFTSDRMSIEKIREQIDAAVSAVKINLDPESAKKFEAELRELGGLLERHLNQNTGKINAKNFVADLNNRENFLMIEKLGQRYAEVGVNAQQSFRKIANEADFLNKKISVSNKTLEKMGTTLMNTIRWNISSSVVNAVTGEFQKMYYFAKDLDRVLTNIRIVSGQSADQMERFALAANESAKALGVSTIEYGQAATLFFQQGLKEADVKKMTDGAIMASRITGVAAADMADLLTSTMNGYRLAADEVTKVTDKLAAVGATTASDFHEIATGMSKVASMANAAGVSLDELTAQIATIVSVTRESPESIGTSLKTIYGRMLMFKTDIEALMEDEDGELFGAPKVEEALQAYSRAAGTQISLFKTAADGRKELRDLGEVIEEIGNSWDTVTDKTVKFGLATALAGSRQQNRLIALFDSWDMYKEAVETSLNAEGTTLKQNAIYMESYEGRLKGLQAAKEELYMVLTDSDSMKGFISMLTKAIELVTSLTEATGGLSTVIGILGASMSKIFATKFHEVGGLSGLFAGKDIEATTQAEIDIKNKLLTINKILGEEEANRLRNNLKRAQDSQKAHQAMFDLISKEAKLIQEIARIEESRLTAASKKKTYDNMDGEDKRLMEESAHLIALKAAYEDLANAKLEAESLIQKAAKETGEVELAALNKSFDEVAARIDDAQARIDNIKAQVPDIEEKAQEHGRTAAFEKKRVGVASDELNKQFEESQKILKTQRAIQTVMMVTPSVISAATDETKSYLDVIQSGLTMLVPMIPTIVGGIMQLPGALAGATGAAATFAAVMATPLGPILAITAGVIGIGVALKAVNNSTKTFAKSMKELEKASDELTEQESAYEDINQQLEQIKARRKEIADINKDDDTTDAEKKALEEESALLDTKYERLERELVIEEMLLQTAREKAEMAAKEAATATMPSDYSFSFDEYGNYRKDQVTVAEELELATAAFVEAENQILDYRQALAELKADEKSTAREIKRAQKDLDNATEARDKAAEHVAEYSGKIKEIIAALENEEGTNKDLIESLKEYLDASTDTIAQTLGMGEAFKGAADDAEEYGKKISDTKDEMEELTKEFENASDKINSYQGILDELNSKEGLSAKSKRDIITKHKELLPYLSDEQELRKQLIQIITQEEEAQRTAYANMLMVSEEFYNAKIKGNKELAEKLSEYYGIDLENYKSLAEAKEAVETTLIQTLSGKWQKYFNVTGLGIKETMDNLTRAALHGDSYAAKMADELYPAYKKIMETEQAFQNLALDLGGIDFKGINVGGKSKSNKGSKSKKDEPNILDSIDAEIRAIKIKNDYLEKTSDLLKEQLNLAKNIEGMEGLNEQHRITGQIIEHNQKLIQSYKDEQDALHKKANDIRNANKKYNIDSWFDANAEQTVAYINQYNRATKDQQQEMSKVFNQMQKVKKAWMESNQKAKNLVSTTKELERELSNIALKQEELVRNKVKELIELEKRNAYLDLERRQRIVNDRLKAAKQEMEDEVKRKQDQIDKIQDEIDRIQESERARQESLKRAEYLEDIAKLENKLHVLQYKNLEDLSEEQAKLVDLEREREQALKRQERIQEQQIKLQELQLKLDNLRREKNIQQLTKMEDGTWQFEYVADERAIEDVNKQIKDANKSLEDLQKEHDKTIKDLKEQTLEDLQRLQKDYDEWERQNDIRRQIESKQRRIKQYQDEIKDLQDKYSKLEERTKEAFEREKENLDRFYTDIDLLTDEKMEELYEIFEGNWSSIHGMLTGYFRSIASEYEALIATLSQPLPDPGGGGSGGGDYGYYEAPSGGTSFIRGGSSGGSSSKTDWSAMYMDARSKGDWQTMEYANRQANIERGLGDIVTSDKDIESIKRKYGGSYHTGGVVGDGSRDLPEAVNRLFNTKADEQMVKAKIGELFVPKENLAKYFVPNMQELVKSAVLPTVNLAMPKRPNVALAGAMGGDTVYYIEKLNVSTNDFQSFIKDFTNVVENHPNKAIMKVKKIGGLR